jgi:hypothetical protein
VRTTEANGETLSVAELLRQKRVADPPDLLCGYGAHSWVYNEPETGMKRCAGSCQGVYQMAYWEVEMAEQVEHGLGFEVRTRAVTFVTDDRWRVAIDTGSGGLWDEQDVVGWVTTPDGYVEPVLWSEAAGRLVPLRDFNAANKRPDATCRIIRRRT